MGYCFMSIEKVKSLGALRAKYNHNYRQVKVENAAKDLKSRNEELIKLPMKDGRQMTYDEIFRERIASLPYYKNHKVYKNAVPALEIVTTFTKNTPIDLEQWKKKNVEWLQDTFNVAGDGKDNVISVMYHADEAGEVHCHAIVIPIDERGHLCASRFTDGSRTMSEHQTSYAQDMQEFGLQRGLKGSQAKHKDIKKFYAEFNQALRDLPEPFRNESGIEYINRAREELMMAKASQFREIMEKQRESLRTINTEFNRRRDILTDEKNKLDIEKGEWKYKLEKTNEEIGNLEAFLYYMTEKKETLEKEVKKLQDEKERQQKEIEDAICANENAMQILDTAQAFQRGYESYERVDPDGAKNLQDTIQYVVHYDEKIQSTERNMDEEH